VSAAKKRPPAPRRPTAGPATKRDRKGAASDEVLFFHDIAAWRTWLEAHHASRAHVWVGYYKRSTAIPSITWPESVDGALCFGWIDGVRYSIDEQSYKIRFTPRKKGSTWSAVNVKRVGELMAAGLMAPAGDQAFASRSAARTGTYAYENRHLSRLTSREERAFKDNETAWRFFQAQPPGYRKTVTWWVMSAKQRATRERRLARLIADSARGARVGMLAGKK